MRSSSCWRRGSGWLLSDPRPRWSGCTDHRAPQSGNTRLPAIRPPDERVGVEPRPHPHPQRGITRLRSRVSCGLRPAPHGGRCDQTHRDLVCDKSLVAYARAAGIGGTRRPPAGRVCRRVAACERREGRQGETGAEGAMRARDMFAVMRTGAPCERSHASVWSRRFLASARLNGARRHTRPAGGRPR